VPDDQSLSSSGGDTGRQPFEGNAPSQRRLYAVADGVQQSSPWRMRKQQIFLGGDAFVTKAQAGMVGQNLSEVPRIQRRARPKPLAFFAKKAPNRLEAMFLAYRSGGYTLKENGDYFGVHYSTVSRALKQHASGKT